MEVQILSRKLIQPSTPTPNHLKTHRLSFFDQLAPPAHIPILFFYPSDGTSTPDEKLQKLQESLSDTLPLFYPLSGRFIKEDLIVDCSDQGVDFIEAKVNLTLNELLSSRHRKLELLNHFLPRDVGLAFLPTTPMVAIQATVFECGGLVICLYFSHVVADGFTASMFMRAWATASRSGIGEVVRPCFDLFSLFPSRDVSGIVLNFAVGVKVVTRVFLFDAAKIEELKAEVCGSGGERKPTRMEVVISTLWKALILASRERNEGKLRNSVMSLPINLRGRTAISTPENLFGNFYTLTPIKFSPEQNSTTEPNLNHMLGLARESIRSSLSTFAAISHGDQVFSALVNLLNQVRKAASDEDVDAHRFTTFCGLRLYETDFGWGEPCLVTSAWLPLEMVVLVDTKCGAGVEAWVALNEASMLELVKDPDLSGLISS